jgi:hypothetical protein
MNQIVSVFALLYVLSSGPTQPLAYASHQQTIHDGGRDVVADFILVRGEWWQTVYAPLIWESDQPSGWWLELYWDLFPIPDESPAKPPTARTTSPLADLSRV